MSDPDAGTHSDDPGEGRAPLVAPATKSSALWGVTGGLSFLVLVQGYQLIAGAGVSVMAKFGVAVLVAVVAGVSTHATRDRLPVE